MQQHAPFLIAVVEDNPALCADLVEFLQLRGFDARGFDSAERFYMTWPNTRFDLLLLDVALPGESGLEMARKLREQDVAGIVMLTALDTDTDQVAGLVAGADAYLSKSSSLEVIEATCHTVLRRLSRMRYPLPSSIGQGYWCLYRGQWKLKAPDGTVVELTRTELAFLAALFEIPGSTVERESLLYQLGKNESPSNLRNLDNAASRLRRKMLKACGIELPVRSGYGKGYTFTGVCEVIV